MAMGQLDDDVARHCDERVCLSVSLSSLRVLPGRRRRQLRTTAHVRLVRLGDRHALRRYEIV